MSGNPARAGAIDPPLQAAGIRHQASVEEGHFCPVARNGRDVRKIDGVRYTKLSALERAKLKSVAGSRHVTAADWLTALEMIYRRYEEQNVVTTKDNP